MNTRFLLVLLVACVLSLPQLAAAQRTVAAETTQETDDQDKKVKPHSGPIVQFKQLKVKKKAFEDSGYQKAILIKTEKDAKKYFDKETLAKVAKVVDMDARHIVVFAWRGSGRDSIRFDVMESYPEQVAFTFRRGRTRDLREHVKVFSLRKNVKWSVRK